MTRWDQLEKTIKPRGWYLAREAGQLAGVSGDTIGQWARRGYIRSSRISDPPRVYSFQDVAEAMLVHELLERGVPHKDIRTTVERLRRKIGDWPLQLAPLATTVAGRERIVIQDREHNIDIGHGSGTQLFIPETIHLRKITNRLTRGGWVVRQLPDLQYIEVDPDVSVQ